MDLLQKMYEQFIGKYVFWKTKDEGYGVLRFGKIVAVALPYLHVERPCDCYRKSDLLAIKNSKETKTVLVNVLTLGMESLEIVDAVMDLTHWRNHEFKGYNLDFGLVIPG